MRGKCRGGVLVPQLHNMKWQQHKAGGLTVESVLMVIPTDDNVSWICAHYTHFLSRGGENKATSILTDLIER